jgi:hypothetical protein
MATTDAHPVPIRAQAYRITFTILDSDGDPVAGATINSGLSSGANKALVSIDNAASVNSANTVTEVDNGLYYLDLTATEMTANSVGIVIRTTTTNAKNTVMVLYPQQSGDILVQVQTSSAGAINAAALNADTDTYQAKVWLFDDNTGVADRYAVAFYKNGQPVTAGITSPTIQVIKMSDGTDLVASTALTQVGSLGLYKRDETTNRVVNGAAYMCKLQATIGGSTRSWFQPVGRDS